MLFETGPGRRRLFRKGDPHHPARKNGKITPDPLEMPYGYGVLLTWYRDWSVAPPKPAVHVDPLIEPPSTRKKRRA